MKKTMKYLFSLLAVVALGFGAVLPTISAQDTDSKEVLSQIITANQDVVSMEGTGNVSLSVSDLASIDANVDFRFNNEERFAAEVTGDATGELSSTPFNLSGEAALVDGVAYVNDGSSWKVKDVTAQEDQLAARFEQVMTKVANQSTDALVNGAQKYFDFSETEAEYVLTLKEGIDAEEFWADVEDQVDVDRLAQLAVDEASAQADQTGVPLTDAQVQAVEDQAMESYEAAKGIAFEAVQHLELRFSKDNHYITYVGADFDLDGAQLEELLGRSTGGLGLTGSGEVNFSNHGETFDIQAPADAPTFE